MAIVAKMSCWWIRNDRNHNDEPAEEVQFGAVYSDDPENPNHVWSKATPAGNLQLTITNPDAQGFFAHGKEYLVTIEEA